jgi:hypothetical protein
MTRKGNAGGRHIALERGLRQGRCGWPFPRPGAVGARPMQPVGHSANPEADRTIRARAGAKDGQFGVPATPRGQILGPGFRRRAAGGLVPKSL